MIDPDDFVIILIGIVLVVLGLVMGAAVEPSPSVSYDCIGSNL